MKKFGLETVFFAVVIPLVVVFTVIFAVCGIILLLPDLLWKGFPWRWETWSSIRSVWQVVWGHLRYLKRAHWDSWRLRWNDRLAETRREREERMAQRVKEEEGVSRLRERQRQVRRERTRARIDSARGVLADLEEVDVILTLQLLANLAPFLFVLPHLLIVAFGTIVTLLTVHINYGPVESRDEPLPSVQVEFEPQIEDQQEADFGPWYDLGDIGAERASSPDFRNLALLSDTGAIRYSKRLVGTDTGFHDCPFTERIMFSRPNSAGRIYFEDARRNRFLVNPGQVFLFEGYRSRAFQFLEDGTLQWVALDELQTEEILAAGERPANGESN